MVAFTTHLLFACLLSQILAALLLPIVVCAGVTIGDQPKVMKAANQVTKDRVVTLVDVIALAWLLRHAATVEQRVDVIDAAPNVLLGRQIWSAIGGTLRWWLGH